MKKHTQLMMSHGLKQLKELSERKSISNSHWLSLTAYKRCVLIYTSFDNDMLMGGKLVPYMRSLGISQFVDNGNEVTLFKYALGTPTIFRFLEKTPEQKQSFDSYMTSKRPASQQQWYDIYPAREKLKNAHAGSGAVLIVDVGGGPGQELIRFQRANPDIPGRLILQDLRITLDRIQKVPAGVEKMEYDFFTPQPIKGKFVPSSPETAYCSS